MGVWLDRNGPFCFSTPSLHPLFVNFHPRGASCLFSALCYWSMCLNVCLQSSRPACLLFLWWHVDTWAFAESLELNEGKREQKEQKGTCLCRRGTMKGAQSEPALGLIMFIKVWWAFDTDSGGWFDRCGAERALVQQAVSYISRESPIFLLHDMSQHRKPH